MIPAGTSAIPGAATGGGATGFRRVLAPPGYGSRRSADVPRSSAALPTIGRPGRHG